MVHGPCRRGEHEAELERQRMLAFRARGRFRAEEEGEETAQKNVNKLRAEALGSMAYKALDLDIHTSNRFTIEAMYYCIYHRLL